MTTEKAGDELYAGAAIAKAHCVRVRAGVEGRSVSSFGLLALVLFAGMGCSQKEEASKPSPTTAAVTRPASRSMPSAGAWQSVRLKLPPKSTYLVFRRRPAHEFLAEYDREILLLREGEPKGPWQLRMNTGWELCVNVYWDFADDLLWLDEPGGPGSPYSLNPQTGEMEVSGVVVKGGPLRVGAGERWVDKHPGHGSRFARSVPASARLLGAIKPADGAVVFQPRTSCE
jgi:hypothetical protein